MKLLVLASLLALIGRSELPKNKEVYICSSPNGKKFHYSESCKGLQTCTYNIEKVMLADAKKAGKKRCGYER